MEGPPANKKAKYEKKPELAITLVGYGKYGKLITNKYMVKSEHYHLTTVIDPTFATEPVQTKDLELRTSSNAIKVIAFESFDSWYSDYYSKLPSAEQGRIVVDVAVQPNICFGLVSEFVKRCKNLNWMVLPKPVVETKEEIGSLVKLMKSSGVQAAVASQWAYSPLPKKIQGELIRTGLNDKNRAIGVVELDFTKENGRSYGTHPPLLELPHCLQLLHSTGVVNYHDKSSPAAPIERSVTGTADVVYVRYVLRNGITVKITSDLNYTPTSQERVDGSNASRTDFQIRTMTASDESGSVMLDVDFWVHFDKTGKKVMREGHFRSYCTGENRPVAEDQLGTMIQKIYEAIWECQQAPEMFESHDELIELSEYQPICEEIMDIEEDWKNFVDAHHGFRGCYLESLRRPSLDLVPSPGPIA